MSVTILDGPTDETLAKTIAAAEAVLGPYRFYRPTPEEIVAGKAAAAAAVAEEQRRREEEEAAAAKRQEEEAAAVRREQAVHTRRYTSILEEQAAAASMVSLPMQQYLMTFVVPAVTKGMAYIVKMRPEDPVESLADFLFDYKTPTEL
jgi:adenylate kinase